MRANGIRDTIEEIVRRYIEGCNEVDAGKIRACFAEDAVHYFPSGAPQGPFVGAWAIAEGWGKAVEALGSIWTVDRVVVDETRREAVMEWTHFKPKVGGYLRGDEWYSFDQSLLITEIRAYYACPPVAGTTIHELGDFRYVERGYPTVPPTVRRSGP